MFLCLFAGGAVQQLPKGLGTGAAESGKADQAKFVDKRYVIFKGQSHNFQVNISLHEVIIIKSSNHSDHMMS